MRKADFKNIKDLYSALKTNWAKNLPLWQSIARIVGIEVNPQYQAVTAPAAQKDECIDDPTAALSVNQAGDYLQGVVWGTGENAFTLEPSEEVKELADASELKAYYKWRTRRLLARMNDPRAGLNTAMKPYFYDQSAFGTSGIGVFENNEYREGIEGNIFIFRNYGVDSLLIDEGKNGQVETVFVPYRWRTNRIVNEFCMIDGKIDDKQFGKLPDAIQKSYNNNAANDEFNIVHGIIPRNDYNPKLKGKRGARYKGIWFMDDNADAPFYEEDYVKLPISVCRAIRIRGEVYGRSSGTMLISTIRSLNFMVGEAIEVIEKQNKPPLGTWGDAILGDKVINTSSDALTTFNPTLAKERDPVFQIHDVGDPSNIVKFLVPYLNEKVVTAFKIDVLLDFNNKTSRTATEMLQRYAIRGRSLAGMILQQKTEMLQPTIDRCISIEDGLDNGGVDAALFKEIAESLENAGRGERIIPVAVLKCKAAGKPWYQIRFNNEIDKLTKTEKLEALMQMLNVITALAALNPKILLAIDWYKLLEDFKDALNVGGNFFVTADEFKAAVKADAEQQAQLLQLQGAKLGSEAQRNISGAKRDEAIAKAERGNDSE